MPVMSTRVAMISGLFGALLVLHQQSFRSMADTWLTDSTYSHGIVIPLIAGYFAWQRRHAARSLPAFVWWPGVAIVAGLSLLWAIATMINVQIVAQLASVALVSAIVLSVAGLAQASLFALPLAYLLFAVPFGEGLVPTLMEWTADFTVGALQLFGIPVFRVGLYFSTSNGNFEVAEACSGVRYLLASAAAGVAFAFFTFHSWKKRLLFIAASLIVPLVANGIRAVGIVLIAHYSGMRLAQGIDHFIYGWIFFGVIIFLLFFAGARFADRPGSTDHRHLSQIGVGKPLNAPAALGAATGLIVILLAGGSTLVNYRTLTTITFNSALPDSGVIAGGWSGPLETDLDWQLGYRGADATVQGAYAAGEQQIEVRIATYYDQEQGGELINSTNRIAGKAWHITVNGILKTASDAVPTVRAARMVRGQREYLVWYWYQQGIHVTGSRFDAKWREVLAILIRAPRQLLR